MSTPDANAGGGTPDLTIESTGGGDGGKDTSVEARVTSGRHYKPPTPTISTNTPSEDFMYLVPLWVPDATFDRIFAEVTGAGTAGAVMRLGIYDDTGGGMPGSLVLDAGTIDGTSATIQSITISQALSAGPHWLAAAVQGGASTRPTVRTVGNFYGWLPLGDENMDFFSLTSFYQTGVSGALPATFSGTATTANTPIVGLRAA